MYFEDNDYMYRMRLAGVPIKYVDELNPDVYLNSQTLEKEPTLGGYIENREYNNLPYTKRHIDYGTRIRLVTLW